MNEADLESRPCRRFTILDGMILVAASAVWSLGSRPTLRSFLEGWRKLRRQGLSLDSLSDLWQSWVVVYVSVVGGVGILTVAFLFIRLHRPRPALRRLIWQPGMMACTIIVAFIPMLFLVNHRVATPVLWLAMSAGVATAWLAAWSCGRLRPEPGWIDRLGRVLGACWIAFAAYPLFLLSRG